MEEQIITLKKKKTENRPNLLSQHEVFPAALQKISCDKKVGCDDQT